MYEKQQLRILLLTLTIGIFVAPVAAGLIWFFFSLVFKVKLPSYPELVRFCYLLWAAGFAADRFVDMSRFSFTLARCSRRWKTTYRKAEPVVLHKEAREMSPWREWTKEEFDQAGRKVAMHDEVARAIGGFFSRLRPR